MTDNNEQVAKNLEGVCRGLFHGTCPTFGWRDVMNKTTSSG